MQLAPSIRKRIIKIKQKQFESKRTNRELQSEDKQQQNKTRQAERSSKHSVSMQMQLRDCCVFASFFMFFLLMVVSSFIGCLLSAEFSALSCKRPGRKGTRIAFQFFAFQSLGVLSPPVWRLR